MDKHLPEMIGVVTAILVSEYARIRQRGRGLTNWTFCSPFPAQGGSLPNSDESWRRIGAFADRVDSYRVGLERARQRLAEY